MRYIISHSARPTTRTVPPSNLKNVKSGKLGEISENTSDLYLDALELMNYENDKTVLFTFWNEKLTKRHPKIHKNTQNEKKIRNHGLEIFR